jgi:putative tryptophan/tyrosine transport system substrate-binding protein
VRRREFVAGLGSAAAWPLAARAQQQGDRPRRVGVVMRNDENDPEGRADLAAFAQRLADLGWMEGANLRIDVRWAAGNLERVRTSAKEVIGLQPDVILSVSTPVTAALQSETRTIPIVFLLVTDPVGDGFVVSVPRPGGNITGFMPHEASIGSKWLELLAETAPGVKRVAAIFNPDTAPYVPSYFLPSFEAAAQSLKIAAFAAPVRSDAEIETVVTSLARDGGGGLVVMPDGFMVVHRAQVISMAARSNVPSIAWDPIYPGDGALLSYGPSVAEEYPRAASYVDRILRGAKPSDLPVQYPTKFGLVLNLKTAKALNLDVPVTVLTLADEVIQ